MLVAEDDAFFQHEGVDLAQLQESLEIDWAQGRFTRGASTITQQLAKNLYLSPSKNPLRKLRELIIARRLEAELKKARILELYLNVIEWGDGDLRRGGGGADVLPHVCRDSSIPPRRALLAGAIINPRLMNPRTDGPAVAATAADPPTDGRGDATLSRHVRIILALTVPNSAQTAARMRDKERQ